MDFQYLKELAFSTFPIGRMGTVFLARPVVTGQEVMVLN